jgi:hypothetical protein
MIQNSIVLGVLIVHFYSLKQGIFDSNELHEFNLSTMKWSQLSLYGDIPKSRSEHYSFVHEKSMYIFGGHHNRDHQLSDIYSFNFNIQNFTTNLFYQLNNEYFSDITIITNDKTHVHDENCYHNHHVHDENCQHNKQKKHVHSKNCKH